MTINTDDRYFTVDTLDSSVYAVDNDGNQIDDEDFSWDEQTKVTIDNAPWQERFDTDEFYKLEYSVAKPLEQTYVIDDQEYTFVKPREELQKSQWKLDNLPWTIHHPDTGAVKDADDVRGFWRGPYYHDDRDEQRLHLYVPVNDSESLEFIDEYKATSVGFTNKLVLPDDYSGEVGGNVDTDNVDAYQTDILYDHVASVERGRFPVSEGGGLVLDNDMELVSGTNGGEHDEGGRGTVKDDGDVSDDLTDTSNSDLDNTSNTTTMTDSDIADMNLEAIAEANDSVSEIVEEKDELDERVDALSEKKSEIENQLDATKETVDDLKDELSEYKMDERQTLVDDLTDLTDYWDEDEMMDEDGPTLDTLEERIELMKDLRDETQTTTTIDDEGSTESGGESTESDYDTSGPIDLSETA